MDQDDDSSLAPAFYRHPCWIDEDRSALPCLYDAEGYPVIDFTPVPQLRRRRIGWDADRQRAFVAALARAPSVCRAAKAVGMSARSAYKLLDKPGAESFAKAWDMAIDHGMNRIRSHSLSRTLEGGDFVPVYRKGRLVRVDYRANDRLAVALLSGKRRDIDNYRRGAQHRWRSSQEWAALDAERAEQARAQAEARARKAAEAQRPRDGPRIRFL